MRNKIHVDAEELRRLYCDEEKTILAIAQEMGVSQTKIQRSLAEYGIPRRKRCMTGEANPRWNSDDRTIDTHGYAYVRAKEHPCANHKGFVLEHRLVMEQVLGRYLAPEEVVHHIDENKQNNHPSNLRLYESEAMHQRHGHGVVLDLSEQELRSLYLDQRKSANEIASMLGVQTYTIASLLRLYEIPRRRSGAQPTHDVKESVLRDLYVNQEMSTRQIAEELGIGSTTVGWYLEKYQIPTRQKGWKRPPVSDASRERISEAARQKYKRRQRNSKGQFE